MHLVDERLPCVADTPGQHEVVPEVGEKGAIDDVSDVSRPALSQDGFVHTGTLATVGKVHVSIRARPFEMQR